MEYSATIQTSESYFAESFRQCLEDLGKFRRWQILVGALILAAATSMLVYDPGYFPGILLFLGIGQILDFYRFRRYWINRYKARFAADSHDAVTITATESGLELDGLDGSETVNWNQVRSVRSTPAGLSLIIGDRQPLYVPDSAIRDRGFRELITRYAATAKSKRDPR